MADRNNRLQVYLTDKEVAQLKEWSNETGKSMSTLARDGILEYIDHDRAARLVDRMDRIESKIDSLVDEPIPGDAHTHKHDTVTKASETVEKTREIADRLRANNEDLCSVSDVERAIEDIAGGDSRTVGKYKEKLKSRSLAFEHPHEDNETWYLDRDMWHSEVVTYAKQTTNPIKTAQRIMRKHDCDVGELPEGKFEVLETA